LSAIQDADSVEEHDQSRKPDGTNYLSLWRKPPDGEANEENGADAKRKSAKVDLADQVSHPDREEYCKDWLRADDVLRKLDHGNVISHLTNFDLWLVSYRARQPAARNCSITRLINSGVGG
jgi:hypothetical protein